MGQHSTQLPFNHYAPLGSSAYAKSLLYLHTLRKIFANILCIWTVFFAYSISSFSHALHIGRTRRKGSRKPQQKTTINLFHFSPFCYRTLGILWLLLSLFMNDNLFSLNFKTETKSKSSHMSFKDKHKKSFWVSKIIIINLQCIVLIQKETILKVYRKKNEITI